MNSRKLEKWETRSREDRKNAYPSKEQEEKHLKALAKLHLEFSHLRTCKDLKLSNETAIHWSDTFEKYILCGVSYNAFTSKGDTLRIEVLHKEADWFRIVVINISRHLAQRSVVMDFNLQFKNLAKFLTFVIPLLKGN